MLSARSIMSLKYIVTILACTFWLTKLSQALVGPATRIWPSQLKKNARLQHDFVVRSLRMSSVNPSSSSSRQTLPAIKDEQAERDFYTVLGVQRNANTLQIKRAYRALAKELHPDAHLFTDTTAQFQEINRAYEVLGNPDLKLKYDLFGVEGLSMKTMVDPLAWSNFGGAGYERVFDLADLSEQHDSFVELLSDYD